ADSASTLTVQSLRSVSQSAQDDVALTNYLVLSATDFSMAGQSDRPFSDTILPRRTRSNRFVTDAYGSQPACNGDTVVCLVIQMKGLARDAVRPNPHRGGLADAIRYTLSRWDLLY